jgi:AcrR family transcriptional regulator
MSPRSSYHHGDLRAALIAAAVELIGEGGLDALSVAAVARRTGVSAAAPYHHFAGRRDLLAAAAIAVAEQLTLELDRATAALGDEGAGDATTSAVETLSAVARAYAAFLIERRAGFDLVFAADLEGTKDEQLTSAGRTLMDVFLRPAREVTGGDAPAALLLIEHVLAAAHGYAGLFVGGFLSRRVTETTEIAAQVEAITRALARDAAGTEPERSGSGYGGCGSRARPV